LTIPFTQDNVKEMQAIANKIRITVLNMVYKAQSGHLGGSFSAAEIITALYFGVMKIDPDNPRWPDRDRLVPSKGHCAPSIYTALSLKGVVAPEALDDLRQMGCILQGHPCMNKVPGIDVSTGSLGHGLSIGVGMALGAKLLEKDFRVFVLLGDGELNEGQNWEAAMAAAKHSLTNLTAIVDRNRIQLDGPTEEIMPLEPLAKKWESFNWHTKTIDGHDITQILDALEWARTNDKGPSVVIANTVKGKGVSFMENSHAWHGKPPSKEEYEMALQELERR
jgi:transketolase